MGVVCVCAGSAMQWGRRRGVVDPSEVPIASVGGGRVELEGVAGSGKKRLQRLRGCGRIPGRVPVLDVWSWADGDPNFEPSVSRETKVQLGEMKTGLSTSGCPGHDAYPYMGGRHLENVQYNPRPPGWPALVLELGV